MNKIIRTSRKKGSYKKMPLGFHGDKYLINLIDKLVIDCGVNTFIETGTNVGSTLSFFSKKYPRIECYSCEPDKKAFEIALNETRELKNVKLMNLTSENFLKTSDCRDIANDSDAVVLYWLDAHGYGFEWPVQDELDFIFGSNSKNIVLIDDYLVPECEEFGYDIYNEQICSHEYIFAKRSSSNFDLYYPNYNDLTSSFHPLRGWGLYFINIQTPQSIKNLQFVKKAQD